jgi:hypothetical protein
MRAVFLFGELLVFRELLLEGANFERAAFGEREFGMATILSESGRYFGKDTDESASGCGLFARETR